MEEENENMESSAASRYSMLLFIMLLDKNHWSRDSVRINKLEQIIKQQYQVKGQDSKFIHRRAGACLFRRKSKRLRRR